MQYDKPNRDRIKWQCPSQNSIKCNVDAPFSEYHNTVRIGICLRDGCGMFLGEKSMWLEPVMSVAIGEVLGLLVAIDWVEELASTIFFLFDNS